MGKKLVLVGPGIRYLLRKKQTLVGRSEKAHVHIQGKGISRVHCYIYRSENDNYTVMDAKSRNGTYVNGVNIRGKACGLNPGDRLGIGPYTFQLEEYQKQGGLADKLN